MLNTIHFDSYCNYICNNIDFKEKLITEGEYLDAIRDYCNNFSSFLLIKKKDLDNIKEYRKNIIIDYYISTYKVDNKEVLNKYYLDNIKDNYNMTFKPPLSYEYYCNDLINNVNDDVNDHYNFINKKCEYYGNKSMIDKNNIEDDLNYAFDDGDTISIVSTIDDYYDEYDDYEDYNDEYYDENEEYFSDDYDY
uniref:Uncharacterized protein n=1 Tax=viral metagenome TaxID=1070528 RepID=A0A6C0J2U6_9ZZZZ